MNEKPVILYVDDDITNISVFTLLHRDRFCILSARSSEAALKLARNKKADILLLDLHMQDRGSVRVLENIKKIHPEIICILIISRFDKNKVTQEFKDYPLDGWLVKPYGPDSFYEIIETYRLEKESY